MQKGFSLTISEMFQELLGNLAVDNTEQISLRYGEITAALNKEFRETDSKTANSLQVGSYGRRTAIKGISDLDMLYIMPVGKWEKYKDGKQSELLTDTKDAIAARYPTTEIFVDRLVVRVLYQNFHVEVQSVFEQSDASFKFPDTYNGGRWRITKPREELSAMQEFNAQKNNNLRRLCKMARAWKNKHGVVMGGLLVDTLAYNFLVSTEEYDDKSFLYYDNMSKDFFAYLKDQPNQEYYAALGSRQPVYVKKRFQKKAKTAYELCVKAIEAAGTDGVHGKWKKVYGRPFPAKPTAVDEIAKTWVNTEEFIEDSYPVDIQYGIKIDCDISQDGFREHPLSYMLRKGFRLRPKKKLKFQVVDSDVEGTFEIYWKILNRGDEAKRLDQIRGQIIPDEGEMKKVENTKFRGAHLVECYAVQNGVVVARDTIDVPIQ